MANVPLLRPRRSTSLTPVTTDGVTPTRENGFSSIRDTPKRNRVLNLKQEETSSLQNTPNGSLHVDASFRCEDKISPMLAKLRMTPGRLLKEKQLILSKKDEESRRKIDSVNVGGGVSLWPEMEKMRLTQTDIRNLTVFNMLLSLLVTSSFYFLHGKTINLLLSFHRQLQAFPKITPLHIQASQMEFDQTVVQWHVNFKHIVDDIHSAFDVTRVPSSYLIYVFVYIATVTVLLYYLVDNMVAKSKLSPKRIKRWVSLLTMTSTWTFFLMLTLVIALRTEVAIETNIHALFNTLGNTIATDLNLDKLHMVLSYWKTRCLPPSTHGTVTIFGVLPVRDVTYYLQYYCIPIVTVLVTPILKLIVSVMSVHNCGIQS